MSAILALVFGSPMKAQFKVKTAVTAITNAVEVDDRLLHLQQLLAWAFLDQKTGRRAGRTNRTTNARRIARLQLGEKVHPILRRLAKEDQTLSTEQQRLLERFFDLGGISKLVKDPSYRSLFKSFKENEKYTCLVFYIVDYLCRAAVAKRPKSQRTIAFAQNFVTAKGMSKATISQSWERYAPAAALIYATYLTWPHLKNCDLMEAEKQIFLLASDPQRLATFLGYAAHAAQALSATSATKVFTKSFLVVPTVQPALGPFSSNELRQIADVDRPSALR
jgi:hypothetical protein